MNLYFYSDESGVFDILHNDFFVFGGLIFLGTEEKEKWSRKYAAAEKTLRKSKGVASGYELKATKITNAEKLKLYRALNQCYKFGVVVHQKFILERIFASKKDKQRYLDFAYKIGVKRALQELLNQQIIQQQEIERIYFYVDEHTTATNGRYELKEGLEQELKNGTFNYNYQHFFEPLFPDLIDLQLEFCNSESKLLVRAADIVANRIYYLVQNDPEKLEQLERMSVTHLPFRLTNSE